MRAHLMKLGRSTGSQRRHRHGESGEAQMWGIGAALAAGFGAAVLGLVGLTWLAWALLRYPKVPHPGTLQLHDTVSVLQLVFASVAGAGALVALIVAYRKQKIAEADSTHDRTRVFNERFTAIAAQLGDDKPAIRLAGVHAMAGLADDWKANRQTCVDVLCAYLRLPYEPDPGDQASPSERLTFQANREVRHTAIRVITAHLKDDAAESWQGLNFDFTGTVFDGGDFGQARFTGGTVDFTNSRFSGGTVNFLWAEFSGGTVNFSEAEFAGGRVDLRNTKFSGSETTFSVAHFSGSTLDFREAKFSGGTVYFGEANFSAGIVDFGQSEFSGGTVYLSGAKFSGAEISFSYASFSGGTLDFEHAEFADGAVVFNNAHFDDGTIDFRFAKFSGGKVNFFKAAFSGGVADFRGTEFDGGTVDFFGAIFSGGTVAFHAAMFFGGTVSFKGVWFGGSVVNFDGATFSGGTADFSSVASWSNPPLFDSPIPPMVKLPLSASGSLNPNRSLKETSLRAAEHDVPRAAARHQASRGGSVTGNR